MTIAVALLMASPWQGAWAAPAHGSFGLRAPEGISPESAAAMFMVGLAVGVALGIAMFFGYLMWRERRETQQDRDLELLLNDLGDNRQGARNGVWGRETADNRERYEQRGEASEERIDPWERPADWWRDT